MKFKPTTRPSLAAKCRRRATAFTLAEVLADQAIMPKDHPLAEEGLRIARRERQLRFRNSVAALLAERVLNEDSETAQMKVNSQRAVIN